MSEAEDQWDKFVDTLFGAIEKCGKEGNAATMTIGCEGEEDVTIDIYRSKAQQKVMHEAILAVAKKHRGMGVAKPEAPALPVGRELDARVAEALGHSIKWVERDHGAYTDPMYAEGDPLYPNRVISYSAADNTAVLHLLNKNPSLNGVFKAETPYWGCGYGQDGEYTTALTIPHAVCLAILKVKEIYDRAGAERDRGEHPPDTGAK